MGRSKKDENSDLPIYLWPDRPPTYWSYNHPQYVAENGRAKFFKADRITAIQMAIEKNTEFANAHPKPIQRKSRPGPKNTAAFNLIAEKEHSYWRFGAHDDPDRGPKKSTIKARELRLRKLKNYFGDKPIHTISSANVSKLYDGIVSTHEYHKICSVLISIFKYARAKGHFPDQMVNPGEGAKLRRIPRETARLTMEPEQFKAIHKAAEDWIQIAMDIILQTALRQQDIWTLRWENIVDNSLYVIPQKSKSSTRKDRDCAHLKFDLLENTSLRKAIHRARKARMLIQGKRIEFRDCPFIICRTDLERVKHNCITKEHPLQITRSFAASEFKKVRDRIIVKTNLFEGWSREQLPAFHAIRKLSLQEMEKAGASRNYLMIVAGHKDFRTTQEAYLRPNNPTWANCNQFEVIL